MGSISEPCMTVPLTIDPHLYYWLTVDLDSFVVHLNRSPYQSPEDRVSLLTKS